MYRLDGRHQSYLSMTLVASKNTLYKMFPHVLLLNFIISNQHIRLKSESLLRILTKGTLNNNNNIHTVFSFTLALLLL